MKMPRTRKALAADFLEGDSFFRAGHQLFKDEFHGTRWRGGWSEKYQNSRQSV
jgi:hypothetical protein